MKWIFQYRDASGEVQGLPGERHEFQLHSGPSFFFLLFFFFFGLGIIKVMYFSWRSSKVLTFNSSLEKKKYIYIYIEPYQYNNILRYVLAFCIHGLAHRSL